MVTAVFKREVKREKGKVCGRHQQGRQSGGDVVGHVVDMGCPAAEVTVSFSLVANHRVERVHHLVGEHAGCTKDSEPEEWGNHAVAQILGQRLEGGGTHFLCREFGSVASYDASHLTAAFVQRAVEGEEHLSYFPDECRAGEAVEDDDSIE